MLSDEQIELEIAKDETAMGQIAQTLLWHNQKLQHDLADPRYMYSGRATRAAILKRDADIQKLRLSDEQIVLKALEILKTPVECTVTGNNTIIVAFGTIYKFHKGNYNAN